MFHEILQTETFAEFAVPEQLEATATTLGYEQIPLWVTLGSSNEFQIQLPCLALLWPNLFRARCHSLGQKQGRRKQLKM